MSGPGLSPALGHALHFVIEWLAIAIGVQLYRMQRRHAGTASIVQPGAFAVVVGCIFGAAIGNKLVFWIAYPQLWDGANLFVLLGSGQSIVGGLLGGLIGVEIAKKLTHQRASTGDAFVLPLIVAMSVGRIGCFLAGLNDATYGIATTLPWGVDFGDGVRRHPTQLYDIGFILAWGGMLLAARRRLENRPGLMFKLYLAGYLAWRLAVDTLKPVPFDYGLGLSGIQLVCLLALAVYLPLVARSCIPTTTPAKRRKS